jgi:3-phosphoshikimate 1-carboxyvinyltransferase
MGTVIFPDALKVFPDGQRRLRAERRHKQLISKGFRYTRRLRADLEARDARDSAPAALRPSSLRKMPWSC